MALTATEVKLLLVKRVGPLFTEVGLDGSGSSSTDLDDPLGFAIRKLGGTVATLNKVTDSDLVGVSETDYDRLFDLAELRGMETALSAARRLVSTSLGPKSEQFSHIAGGLEKDIAAKRRQMAAEYGAGISTLEAGAISLRFAESNETS